MALAACTHLHYEAHHILDKGSEHVFANSQGNEAEGFSGSVQVVGGRKEGVNPRLTPHTTLHLLSANANEGGFLG